MVGSFLHRALRRRRVGPLCQVRCRSGSDPAARRCGRGSGPAVDEVCASAWSALVQGRVRRSTVGSRPSLSSSHVVRCVPRRSRPGSVPVSGRRRPAAPVAGSSTGTSNRLDSPDHRPAATAASSGGEEDRTPATRAVHAHPDTSAVVRTTPVRPSPAAATRPRACSGSDRAAGRSGHRAGRREDEYHRGHPPDDRAPGQRRDQGDEADEGEGDDAGSHLRPGGRHGAAAEQRLGGATGEPGPGRREEQDQQRARPPRRRPPACRSAETSRPPTPRRRPRRPPRTGARIPRAA